MSSDRQEPPVTTGAADTAGAARSAGEHGGPTRLGARGQVLLALVVLLVVAVGYGGNLRDAFLSDDYGFLLRSVQARDVLDGLDVRAPQGMWVRPLTSLSWYANTALGDFRDPLGYHLVNVLLHALNAWLVARLVLALGGPALGAAAAALLFASFPLHPEAVTWLSGRVDVLCATGLLAGLIFWVRYARAGRPAALALACLGFAAAVLSKEMGATFPGLALVLGLLLRAPPRRLALGLAGLLLVGLLYAALRYRLLGGLGGYSDASGAAVAGKLDPFRAVQFVQSALRLLAAPLSREALPAGLGALRFLPGALALAGLLWCAAGRERRRRLVPLAALALVALLSTAPVAGWAFLGDGFRHTRFLYVPSAFALGAAAWLFADARAGAARRGRAVQLAALALLLAVQVAGILHANAEWREAARLARVGLERLDARAPAGRPGPLVVTNLPDVHGDAWLWLNGFRHATRLLTRWQGPVLELEGAEWEGYLAREWREHDPTFLVWNPAREDWDEARRAGD